MICLNFFIYKMLWIESMILKYYASEEKHDQLSGFCGLLTKQFSPSPVVAFVMSGSTDVIAEAKAVSALN